MQSFCYCLSSVQTLCRCLWLSGGTLGHYWLVVAQWNDKMSLFWLCFACLGLLLLLFSCDANKFLCFNTFHCTACACVCVFCFHWCCKKSASVTWELFFHRSCMDCDEFFFQLVFPCFRIFFLFCITVSDIYLPLFDGSKFWSIFFVVVFITDIDGVLQPVPPPRQPVENHNVIPTGQRHQFLTCMPKAFSMWHQQAKWDHGLWLLHGQCREV